MAAAPPKTGLAGERTDLCVANGLVSTGLGFASGAVLSLLVFKRRAWPIWLGLGFGLGSSYADCQRIANPVTLPNVRVLAAGSPEAKAAPASASTFELLQTRAGELFSQASSAVQEKTDSAPAKAEEAKSKLV